MDRFEKQRELKTMERVHKIYEHPLFRECLEKNCEAEKERVFCRHDMAHFMDVARLSYIFSLEREYAVPKEEIYAAALLHDIGKWKQYKDGTPHDRASALIAEEILQEAGYSKEEIERILNAILCHRSYNGKKEKHPLAEVLYDADKISRACYACPAKKECNWSEDKKNKKIIW